MYQSRMFITADHLGGQVCQHNEGLADGHERRWGQVGSLCTRHACPYERVKRTQPGLARRMALGGK